MRLEDLADKLFRSPCKKLDVMSSSYHTLMQVSFSYDFEPHGRASETWEKTWIIKLNCINPLNSFKGKNLDEAVNKALMDLEQREAEWTGQ